MLTEGWFSKFVSASKVPVLSRVVYACGRYTRTLPFPVSCFICTVR